MPSRLPAPPPASSAPPGRESAPRPLSALAEKQRGLWRRTYLWVALVIALFIPLGLLLGWEPWSSWWLAAWSGSMLLGALSLRFGPRLVMAAGYALAAFSGVCATVLVGMYGPGSAGFGLLLALPLGVMALSPSLPMMALLVGVGTLGGGLLQIARFQPGLEFTVTWVALSVALTVIAVIGARGFRRVWIGELLAQREKRAAQQQLAESEQRRALGERLALAGRLAAAVGHEINNPLSVVKSGVDYLRAAGAQGPPPDALEVLEEIDLATRQIALKVAAMQALSQGAAAELEAVPAGEWIAAAWSQARGALAQVRATPPPLEGLPAVQGLRPLLVSALEGVLVNAAEAARLAPDPAGREVRLQVDRRGGTLAVVVEDGGPGLGPEVLARLFEPFFTTKGPARSGLGLAVAREQVLRCGGTLEAANRPGGGARFTLSLPLVPG